MDTYEDRLRVEIKADEVLLNQLVQTRQWDQVQSARLRLSANRRELERYLKRRR